MQGDISFVYVSFAFPLFLPISFPPWFYMLFERHPFLILFFKRHPFLLFSFVYLLSIIDYDFYFGIIMTVSYFGSSPGDIIWEYNLNSMSYGNYGSINCTIRKRRWIWRDSLDIIGCLALITTSNKNFRGRFATIINFFWIIHSHSTFSCEWSAVTWLDYISVIR